MAHSILEYGDRHLTMRDMDLLEVLEFMVGQLGPAPEPDLAFLPDFLASDMVHDSGGIDPDLGAHLKDDAARAAFINLTNKTAEAVHDHPRRNKIVERLEALRGLVEGTPSPA